MRFRPWIPLCAGLLATATPGAAQLPTYASQVTAQCAGASGACNVVDFFLGLIGTTATPVLDVFTLSLHSTAVWRFASPGISDGDDALSSSLFGGELFVDQVVSGGGQIYTANFSLFPASLDGGLSPTLRLRAEMESFGTGASDLFFDYEGRTLSPAELVVAGSVGGTAPPSTVPEPASLVLLGTGLAGVALRRRRARDRTAS